MGNGLRRTPLYAFANPVSMYRLAVASSTVEQESEREKRSL
jgi:hypothetical protein